MLPAVIAGVSTKRWVKPLIDRVDHAPLLKINALILCTAIFRFAFISLGTPLLADCALLAVPGAADSMPFAAMGGVVLKDPPGQDANSGNSLFSMAQMPEIGLGISAGGDFACLIAGQSDCYPVRNADEFHARWSGAIESDFVLARWKGSLSWSKHPSTGGGFQSKRLSGV